MTYQTELTQVSKLAFRDFDFNLKPNPKTGDILLKSTSDSIKQSVRNLLLTQFYERPFRPFLGSNITASLFELPSPDLAIMMEREILRVIETHEPRVTDVSAQVEFFGDEQTLRCKVGYLEIGQDITTTLEVFLERNR
jgi:phage baseplate assembly protein W